MVCISILNIAHEAVLVSQIPYMTSSGVGSTSVRLRHVSKSMETREPDLFQIQLKFVQVGANRVTFLFNFSSFSFSSPLYSSVFLSSLLSLQNIYFTQTYQTQSYQHPLLEPRSVRFPVQSHRWPARFEKRGRQGDLGVMDCFERRYRAAPLELFVIRRDGPLQASLL